MIRSICAGAAIPLALLVAGAAGSVELRWATATSAATAPLNPSNAFSPDGNLTAFNPQNAEQAYAGFSPSADETPTASAYAAFLGVSQATWAASDFIAFECNGGTGQGFESSTWIFNAGSTVEHFQVTFGTSGAVSDADYTNRYPAATGACTGDWPFVLFDLQTVDPTASDFSVTVVRGPLPANAGGAPDIDFVAYVTGSGTALHYAGALGSAVPPVDPAGGLGAPDGTLVGFAPANAEQAYGSFSQSELRDDSALASFLGVDPVTLGQADFIAFENNGDSSFPFEDSTWIFQSQNDVEVVDVKADVLAEGDVSEAAYEAFFSISVTDGGDWPFFLVDLQDVDPTAPDFRVTVRRGPGPVDTPDPDAMAVLTLPQGSPAPVLGPIARALLVFALLCAGGASSLPWQRTSRHARNLGAAPKRLLRS